MGFEIARYDYALTEDGIRLLERKKEENFELWQEFTDFARVMTAAGELNYWELSIAAKAYFILKSAGTQIGLKEIQNAALKLGWEVTEEEIQKACAFLEKVNLVYHPAT